mmetsp:Transcript_7725/g.18602  ORF Transcript_7725/g.18602 Transcript_7725/m.18602 type:complete len:203 (-) Transcript_7725:681-1289(-)
MHAHQTPAIGRSKDGREWAMMGNPTSLPDEQSLRIPRAYNPIFAKWPIPKQTDGWSFESDRRNACWCTVRIRQSRTSNKPKVSCASRTPHKTCHWIRHVDDDIHFDSNIFEWQDRLCTWRAAAKDPDMLVDDNWVCIENWPSQNRVENNNWNKLDRFADSVIPIEYYQFDVDRRDMRESLVVGSLVQTTFLLQLLRLDLVSK